MDFFSLLIIRIILPSEHLNVSFHHTKEGFSQLHLYFKICSSQVSVEISKRNNEYKQYYVEQCEVSNLQHRYKLICSYDEDMKEDWLVWFRVCTVLLNGGKANGVVCGVSLVALNFAKHIYRFRSEKGQCLPVDNIINLVWNFKRIDITATNNSLVLSVPRILHIWNRN